MDFIIKSMVPGLPCGLEIFKINNKEADIEDFGEIERWGSCLNYTCSQTFKYKLPTDEVLKKYSITLGEYSTVCDELEDLLEVTNCGMCS